MGKHSSAGNAGTNTARIDTIMMPSRSHTPVLRKTSPRSLHAQLSRTQQLRILLQVRTVSFSMPEYRCCRHYQLTSTLLLFVASIRASRMSSRWCLPSQWQGRKPRPQVHGIIICVVDRLLSTTMVLIVLMSTGLPTLSAVGRVSRTHLCYLVVSDIWLSVSIVGRF